MPLLAAAVNGFWKSTSRAQGECLCLSVLNQARTPFFYESWGVPDTLEGRFDCAVLHMAILLRHLKGPVGQAAFDAFFSYTELTLREIGVSDLRVGKQVKQCATFFYGALKAYNEALDHQMGLGDAIARNLFGAVPPASMKEIEAYVRACDLTLQGQDCKKTKDLKWPSLSERRM
jgi:cytochrome b pre-mRNA-processing protein 3